MTTPLSTLDVFGSPISLGEEGSLTYGRHWSTADLTYSFINSEDSFFSVNYDVDSSSGVLITSISNTNSAQQEAFRSAFLSWSDVANIAFSEVSESKTSAGIIRLGLSTNVDQLVGSASGFAYLPDSTYPSSGDIWLNALTSDVVEGVNVGLLKDSSFGPASYAYSVVVHEIGHAIGLKHPFEPSVFNSRVIDTTLDTISNSIMSYRLSLSENIIGLTAYPTTPMPLDIEAIQNLYGANLVKNSGDTTFKFDDTQIYFETIWDPSGTDTIQYDGVFPLELSLETSIANKIGRSVIGYGKDTSERYEIPNLYIAENVFIENASGGIGNDTIKGNSLNNTLFGNPGNDSLFGLAGNDALSGGWGNDTIDGGDGFDTYMVSSSSTAITVERLNDGSFFLDGNGLEGDDTLLNIERVIFESDQNVLALDIGAGQNAGQVYRLYQASFARSADTAGVSFHLNDIENNGLSFYQVANNFLNSPEFRQTYNLGNEITNDQYIELLYQNVLGRTAEEFEKEYYSDRFTREETDALFMDQTMALIGFSESPENIELVGSQIENGIWLT